MTVVSYHSTIIGRVASAQEATGTTSSQIFLSRGVAGSSGSGHEPPQGESSVPVTSILESASMHVMTVGDAACSTVSDGSIAATTPSACTNAEASRTSFKAPAPGSAATIIHREHHRLHPSSIGSDEDFRTSDTTKIDIVVDKGKSKEIERGRPLEKGPRFLNPIARAESRSRENSGAIEIDGRPIQKRISRSSTFFDDPSDPCAILEDNLLEPCPHLPICHSVSEVLNGQFELQLPSGIAGGRLRASTAVPAPESIRDVPEKSARALTTVFSDCLPLYPAPTLPPDTVSHFQPDISQLEYLAIKSSSHFWSSAQSTPRSEIKAPSLGVQLPVEVIQQILNNLSPVDFNSARHTCRSWFISSLDRSLLETMLKRGGWSSDTQHDPTTEQLVGPGNTINGEWLMSKAIAQECALGPDWKGNGIFLTNGPQPPGASSKSAFVHTSTFDFTEVAIHYNESAGIIFTVSSCGRFLMAANGCLIYIYEINRGIHAEDDDSDVQPGNLRPVTSIICPRRVLACSMDTSSHRYAIAVLLDGRMGLVCDINHSSITATRPARSQPGKGKDRECSIDMADNVHDGDGCRRPSFLDRVSLNSSASSLASGRAASEPPPFVFPGIATSHLTAPTESAWQDTFRGDMPETIRTAGPSSRHPSLPRHAVRPEGRLHSILPPCQETNVGPYTMPLETGPRSLYRNLYSDDDPPRSVAICPQRRCVAFGCSAGIELHWIDALTGQDLNRWFPLTAPSDYLFFLPPRMSVDSAKKLRLISSAAKPRERPAINQRAFGGKMRRSPFWEKLGWGVSLETEEGAGSSQGLLSRLRSDTDNRRLSGRINGSDHYRAIPLSDGYHILFTDPTTDLLCLGSDAPVGGPTKLLRKIWFKGPEGAGSPVAYASGANLSKGVRVVAAFGTGVEQRIWFFSVPRDIFAANQGSQTLVGSSWLRASSSHETRNTEWMTWWPDDGLQEWLNHAGDPVAGILPRSIWPVKIRGQEIGTCRGLVDLAVDSGPAMTVWAFSKEGNAKVWRLDDGQEESARDFLVIRDGTIRAVDGDGDVEMTDVSTTDVSTPDILQPPLPLVPESLDGMSSCDVSDVITRRFVRRYGVESNQLPFNYGLDGDGLTGGLSDPGVSQNTEGSFEALSFSYRRGPNVYQSSRHFDTVGNDLVETLTGMTRIDIDIR